MNRFAYTLLVTIISFVTGFMVVSPEVSVQAAKQGAALWWNVVLPALLPFFIVSELLIRLKVMNHIGRLLDPLMRPLFNLPGASGLAVAMGYTSGFPVGAVISSRLLSEGLIDRDEAVRLIAFTNNSSPLFIIGAIGVGMLDYREAGYLLAASHYLSNLLVGWLLGHTGQKNRGIRLASPNTKPDHKHLDIEPVGLIVSQAIRQGLINIGQIGGYIVFFMVLSSCLNSIGLFDLIAAFFPLVIPDLSPHLARALPLGFMEITQGAQAICQTEDSMLPKLLALSAILSFSGLCILAQISSIMAEHRLPFVYYVKARLIQIPLSLLITWIGYHMLPAPPAFMAKPSMILTPQYPSIYYIAWLLVLFTLAFVSVIMRLVASSSDG